MTDPAPCPGIEDVRSAARAIEGVAIRPPLIRSDLDENLWMKLETLQPSGAFKLRGAANAVAKLPKGVSGVVCCSTGNHGRAVAHAARALGIPATVCLSELVPEGKVRAVEALGARVIRKGRSQDEAQREADRLVESEGLVDVPPFDHFDVIAGQGTCGLEILEERPEIETLLIPLSGGGLAAGVAMAAKALKPEIRCIGISMDRGAAMSVSMEAGQPVEVEEVPSLADSLGGGIGLTNRFSFRMCKDLIDEVILLTEDEIYRGMQALYWTERLVAEGACAVAHGAVLAGKHKVSGPTATIITGRNVDMTQFNDVAQGRDVTLGGVTVEGSPWTTS